MSASRRCRSAQPHVIGNDLKDVADQEGVIISKSLGQNRSILLAHHGQLTTGDCVEEATYLSVYLERSARMQIRARAFGPLTPISDVLAAEAHDYLLKPSLVKATFDYWCRQADRESVPNGGP